jgi:hypothetical protein
MIKIQNNTATREPLPSFLIGLMSESLLNLEWTDPQLGVQDCAWWQETHDDAPIDTLTHKYGAEILTINHDAKTVSVTHEIVALTPDEIAANFEASKNERKRELELKLTAFAAEKDIDIVEIPMLLNSTNEQWKNEALHFQSIYLQSWQAFYNDEPLPLLEWGE